jgi:predicted permease
MIPMPRRREQTRTLVRTFLSRFFENDFTGNADDVRTMFFAFLAVMAVPGVVVPLFLWAQEFPVPGWDLIARRRGVEALRAISRADKVLYLGFAMIAAGIVSAVTWSSLIVDRKDGLVLGGLPVRPSTVVLAKLAALAAFVTGVAVAIHLAASFSFGGFLATHNTFRFAVRGIAAHLLASCAASVFVLMVVAGIQGLVLALAGPRWFERISPALQTGLVVAVLGTALFLPAVSDAVAGTLAGGGASRPWILLTPPLWFLGLYESILGTTDRRLIGLALDGAAALGAAGLVVAATYPLAYRRLMRAVVEQRDSVARLRISAGLIDFVVRIVARRAEIRAVVQFFLTALVRQQRQRLMLATAVGLVVVWGVPAWTSLAAPPTTPDLALLRWAVVAPLLLILGLRMAAAFPVDAAGAWMFDVLPPTPKQVHAAVERTVLVGIGPVVAAFATAVGGWWGLEPALIHAGFSAATSLLFFECLCLFWRFDRVPCTQPWNAGALNVRFWWPVYGLLFLLITRGLPLLDLILMESTLAAACVIAVLAVLAVRVRQTIGPRQRVPADEAAGVLSSALKARWLSEKTATREESHFAGGVRRDAARAHALLQARASLDRWGKVRGSWREIVDAFHAPTGVFRRDAALALRRLAKAPLFTSFSIVTLAGSVAATTVAFAVVHAVLWTRPPIADLDRLVDVSGERFIGARTSGAFSWPDFADLSARQTMFTALAAGTQVQVPFVGGQASAIVGAGAVSGEFFRTLGIRAVAGRMLEPSDDRPDAEPVAVISYNLWRLRFDGSPAAIGTTVRLDGQPFRVVGVTPRGFNGADLSTLDRASAIWMPLHVAVGEVPYFLNGRQQTVRELLASGDRDARWLGVRARLRAERTIEQASQEVRAIGGQVEESFPSPRPSDSGRASRFHGRRWSAGPPPDDRPLAAGRLFIALVGFVLLIGATNLANLGLARGAAREHEFAVRRALGASRADLIREQLLETAFVGAAASGLGWLAVRAALRQLVFEIPGRPDQFLLLEPLVSGPLLMFAIVTGLAALAITGLWPALQVTGPRLRGGVASAGATTPPFWHFHRRMIRWQVAGSVTLLFLAAACIGAVLSHARNAVVDVDRLAIATFTFSVNRYDRSSGRAVVDAVLDDVARRPGVSAAAASGDLPFDGGGGARIRPVTLSDEPLTTHGDPMRSVQLVPATPEIFRTLGVQLLRGRGLGAVDTASTPAVAVINAAFAERLWGTADVVGRELVLWPPARQSDAPAPAFRQVTIVGVASDTGGVGLRSRQAGVLYVPMNQHAISRAVITVRSSGDDPNVALMSLHAAIRQVAPDLVLGEIGTGSRLLGGAGLALGLLVSLVTPIGTLALLFAMTGLFGILSELVSRRTREFGVRSALGASRGRMMQLVLRDGLQPVLGGLVLGAFVGAVSRSMVASALSLPVKVVDPVEFLAVTVLLLGAAAGACYWPARRAARVDPNIALRTT